MTVRVNGGIINDQTLTGSLRYFKMTGPFAYTKSDGTVNIPNTGVVGGPTGSTTTTYFQVGDQRPVPGSAAELALREIAKQADITIITLFPFAAAASGTTAIHFACSASAFGWGSNTPDYSTPPANAPEDLTAAAPAMQAAVRALGVIQAPTTAGVNPTPPALPNTNTPATAARDLGTVVITEVPFVLA